MKAWNPAGVCSLGLVLEILNHLTNKSDEYLISPSNITPELKNCDQDNKRKITLAP